MDNDGWGDGDIDLDIDFVEEKNEEPKTNLGNEMDFFESLTKPKEALFTPKQVI